MKRRPPFLDSFAPPAAPGRPTSGLRALILLESTLSQAQRVHPLDIPPEARDPLQRVISLLRGIIADCEHAK